jgi:hypothetical protein
MQLFQIYNNFLPLCTYTSCFWRVVYPRCFRGSRILEPSWWGTPLPPPPPRPLPPPVSIKQLLTTQNELMRMLVDSDARCGVGHPPHHRQEMDSSYSDFLVTHPPVFAKLTDPLESDNWLSTIESKFGLLHYTEYQKTLYTAQQL